MRESRTNEAGMAMKIHVSSKILISFLSCSLFLNLLSLYVSFGGGEQRLTWTRKAALEAEAVASLSCSGHGRAFLDGIAYQGLPTCECYSCYEGPTCSQFSPHCPADAGSGDPLFLEPFWMQKAESSAIVVAGWHRMSYSVYRGTEMCKELERHIRLLHSLIGNANTTGKFILFGDGSTQLLNAAVHALSQYSSSPSRVVAAAPYYMGYAEQTQLFESEQYEWQGDTSQWKNISKTSTNFIEFVTSPNNPDGHLRSPILKGLSKPIHDYVYYWPHFTAIPFMADEDIMLFSISKLTGHAGSRFGWAIVKDEEVYRRMLRYTQVNTMGSSHESQSRVLKLLKVVREQRGRDIFNFGYNVLRNRWRRLNKSLSVSTRFSLQKISPMYCTYFNKIRDPSPGVLTRFNVHLSLIYSSLGNAEADFLDGSGSSLLDIFGLDDTDLLLELALSLNFICTDPSHLSSMHSSYLFLELRLVLLHQSFKFLEVR